MPSYTCPTCGKTITVEDRLQAPHRPFCDRRCQLVDLGKWFDEEYRIEGPPPQEPGTYNGESSAERH